MRQWQHYRFVGPVVLALLALLALGFAVPESAVQPAGKWFQFQIEPSGKKETDENLYLRPNTPHTVGIWLTNLDPKKDKEPLKDAVVNLVNVATGQIVATAKVDDLAANMSKRLHFTVDKESAKKDIMGPKPRLQLQLIKKDKSSPVTQLLNVKIKRPADYIDAKGKYDPVTGHLSVDVKMKEEIPGTPKCVVQLVVDPWLNPGLKPGMSGGSWEQTLTALEYAKLEAEDLALDLSREARVFLTVDGYERAFEFRINSKGDLLNAPYNQNVAVRFRVDRYLAPTPKLPITLLIDEAIDLDGAVNTDMRVEVGLDRTGSKAAAQFKQNPEILEGLRDIRIRVDAGPKGDLLIETQVQDWKINLDTKGILRPCTVRVRVLKKTDNEYEEYPISKLALEPLAAADPRYAKLELEALDQGKIKLNRLYADVIFDNTMPDGVRVVVPPPKDWQVGQPLTVRAIARPRSEDRQAPIEKALFFYGKLKDGKTPADAIQGEFDPKTKEWFAKLPPVEKEGEHPVTVQLMTRTGSSNDGFAVATATKPVPPEKQPTSIKGTVFHGSNSQPGLTVFLLDAKKYQDKAADAVVDSVKTGDKGQYEFAKVAPGNYVLAASKSTPPLVARVSVKVLPEGKIDILAEGKKALQPNVKTVDIPLVAK